MLGLRNRKKEVVRIDVDWLLGETTSKSTRDFSWFKRAIVCLTFVSVAVWSWPYASKAWLKWEWQQQLAQLSGKQSEDVLPIMLALKELSPNERDPSSVLPSNESLSNTATPTSAETPPILAVSPISKSLSDSFVEPPQIAKVSPTRPATAMRISDSSLSDVDTLDPPSMQQIQTGSPLLGSQPTNMSPIPTSMRTPMDQAATSVVPQLPNVRLTIPRTVTKAMVVPAPPVSPEPVDEPVPSAAGVTLQTQEFTAIRGIEKLPLKKLLPLLISSQPRIVQQAFNELVRRGQTPKQLEIAVALAQGDVEQRLKAMETIARDPRFEESITWLVWMAESADQEVRRRAVVLLGSMTNPDALRALRVLQSSETNSAIADQISQVLLASGTASLSVR